jgi:hypothetical protein
MEAVKPKPDITLDNVLSTSMTVVSLIRVVVTVSLSYGSLRPKDEVHDMKIAAMETQLSRCELAEQSANAGLSTTEGDIRAIRQILEDVRQLLR